MSVSWQFRDTNWESHCRTRQSHIQIRTMYRRTVNKSTCSNPRYNTKLFYFSVSVFKMPNEQVSIDHERACEWEYFPEYLQHATRTCNRFNKIMRTGNRFNTVIMNILPSKQEREILFEATRTCVWLKLDVCSMRVRFATQQRDTSGLINHQVKHFAKRTWTALSPFSYIEGKADL